MQVAPLLSQPLEATLPPCAVQAHGLCALLHLQAMPTPQILVRKVSVVLVECLGYV